jgi:hypothetical protein
VPDCDKGCMMVPHEGTLALIIKGEIVVPTPKEVVKSYDLP